MMSNHKKKIKLTSSVVFILSIVANISSQASKETASKTSENTSSQAYESVSETLKNTLSQAYESGSKTLENALSQAKESGSKTLENALSQAKESGSKIAKVLLSCLVTAVSKTIYKFLTPIVLFLIAYAIYYNYFVLHSGVVSSVISCIFGSVGYAYNLAASAMDYIFRRNSEQKNEKKDEKKVPELITVEELETGVKNIENELKSKDHAKNVVGEVKNKIDELKSRINATRGGFINGLKYYITTLLLFKSTRYEYNRLEDKLNSLMKCSNIIIEISQFNNKLKEKFKNLENDNNLTLRGLLSNKEELNKDFTMTLDKIRLLESNEYKELGNIAQSLKNEVQDNYLGLVKEVAKKQFDKIMEGNGDAEEFSTLFYDICTNIKWPEEFLKKIEKIGKLYLKRLNVALLIKILDSTVEKIAPPNEVKNIYNEIEEIKSLLSSGFFTKFLKVIFFEKKEVKDQSISLLDKIYRNYDEIEEKYKLLKQMISKYKISLEENKKIKEKKELFEAICGKESVIKNAKDAYMKVDEVIKKLDTNVETERKGIFEYIKSINEKIGDVLKKLKNELENLETNGNSKELNRVLEKKISNEESKYLKISKNLDTLHKKIENWKKSVESKKGYEQIANNIGKNIEVLAAEICNSEKIEEFINKNGDKYKENLLNILSKEKGKMLLEVNDMLSSVKKEIDDKKNELNAYITNVKQFLEKPQLGDSKTKYDELKKILKKINDFAKGKTDKKSLFYPENTGIEEVNNLANLLEIYSYTNEIVNQKNDGIDKLFKDLSIYIEKFKSINNGDYYNIYCKCCVDQIKLIIDEHLKNNKEINYAISLTNLEKIIELLPNEESKIVLEEAINTLKTNWSSTLNGYLKDDDGKITMSDNIENIVNKDVYSILNKTIEYINEAAAATRLEKKDNITAEYLIKLFNKINEADKNLKILNTDYKIEISLLNKKIEDINSYIQKYLKNIGDESIFKKFFNDFAYSLKNNNNKEAERLFSNMETFFSKFYKDSEICKFFSNNKGLKKGIEDILLTKKYGQIEIFGDKYEGMPKNIKETIANCFKKETENLLKEYLSTKGGVFYDEDNTSRGREILKSIHFNIRKFKAICGTDFGNGLDICIVHVLNELENPSDEKSSNFSEICNELIIKASECYKNKSTIFENVIVKLWCDFISYKNDVDKGDVVVSYVKKFGIEGLKNKLQKDNFIKLSNTIKSIKEGDVFSTVASAITSFLKSQYS